MLKELNEAGKKFGLRITRKKTQFMKNRYSMGEEKQLKGSPIAETPSYLYLGRLVNMENDLDQELIRRSRAAWAAIGSLKEVTDQLTNPELRAHCLVQPFSRHSATHLRRGQTPPPRQ